MAGDKKSYLISQASELDLSKIRGNGSRLLSRLQLLHQKNRLDEFRSEAQNLVDYLNRAYGLPRLTLKLKDSPREHWQTRNGRSIEKHGFYRGATITIYTQTAKKKQLVAFKTLLSTVLHEWLHHYDRHHLKIQSYHTSGFYRRLRQLQQTLFV